MQGELKESLPQNDFEILMDGEYYSIGKPVNLYLFIRNKDNVAREFPYEISIESKQPETESAAREAHNVIKGNIIVEAGEYKLEKVEMIAEQYLKIGRVIYAVAKTGDMKAIETFEIVPSYKILEIQEKNINKGQIGKLILSVENMSNNSIDDFTAKLLILSPEKLKIKDGFSKKKLVNFQPNKKEVLEWEVEGVDTGYAQIAVEIISDGIPNKIGKLVQIGYANTLSIDAPDIETTINMPTKLKIKITNLSSVPATVNLEFSHEYDTYIWNTEKYDFPITVDQPQKTVNLGFVSEECVKNECSVEIEWIITASEYGSFDYIIKAEGFELQNAKGEIIVAEKDLKIDLLIDSDSKISEKIATDREKPVIFEIEVKNLSDKTDKIKVNAFPNGTSWYTYLYDGDYGETFANTTDIPAYSSHKYRLVLIPYKLPGNPTNPFKVEVEAQSRIDYRVIKKVFAKVELKE